MVLYVNVNAIFNMFFAYMFISKQSWIFKNQPLLIQFNITVQFWLASGCNGWCLRIWDCHYSGPRAGRSHLGAHFQPQRWNRPRARQLKTIRHFYTNKLKLPPNKCSQSKHEQWILDLILRSRVFIQLNLNEKFQGKWMIHLVGWLLLVCWCWHIQRITFVHLCRSG